MNKKKLERHLKEHDCSFGHHGAEHDVWRRNDLRGRAAVPRHNEIKYPTARSICSELGIPPPPGK